MSGNFWLAPVLCRREGPDLLFSLCI